MDLCGEQAEDSLDYQQGTLSPIIRQNKTRLRGLSFIMAWKGVGKIVGGIVLFWKGI